MAKVSGSVWAPKRTLCLGRSGGRLERQTQLFLLLLLVSVPAVECQYSVHRQDPFALLSGTLRTRQTAACDGQELTLECPEGTKISIQLVEYGRKATSEQVIYHLTFYIA